MKSVVTEEVNEETYKYSTDLSGYKRIILEQKVFEFLEGCSSIPNVINMKRDGRNASITMQTLQGKSLREILDMKNEYAIKSLIWSDAKKVLKQYVDAEMDLLDSGALYRDLNFDHVFFTDNKAFLVDLESTVIRKTEGEWILGDMRGTWETMALEEFPGYGRLSARTATYRVAVVAYILLAGKLPFRRFPHSRSATHHWRKKRNVEVSDILSKNTQRVFNIALARKQEHRYKDPARFFEMIEQSYRANL